MTFFRVIPISELARTLCFPADIFRRWYKLTLDPSTEAVNCRHTIKPETPEHGTTEHWRNTGTMTKQSKYHGIVEHEKSSGITEKQNNTKKYYQYRTTTY